MRGRVPPPAGMSHPSYGRDRFMDRWDVIIILVAGYVAVVSLVRLMARRRNELVDQVRDQLAQARGGSANPTDADD